MVLHAIDITSKQTKGRINQRLHENHYKALQDRACCNSVRGRPAYVDTVSESLLHQYPKCDVAVLWYSVMWWYRCKRKKGLLHYNSINYSEALRRKPTYI